MTPQLNNKRVPLTIQKLKKNICLKQYFLYKDGYERQALNIVSKYKNKFLFGL